VRRPVLLLLCLLLVAAAAVPATAQPQRSGPAERTVLDAETVLPPGNSMRYTLDGQAAGTLTGDPGDFGEHVDDQREMYWDYEFKDGGFREECDDPVVLREGSRYCLDEFGVPAVYGETDADVWYAAGYSIAQLRLFLIDAIRRTARGTLSELTGPAGVPADIEARVHGYTEEEYDAFFDRLSTEAQTAIDSYVEGVNDYIADLSGERIDELPAEYALLSAAPEPLDRQDVLAAGVLMTREVAAEGGTEMENVEALRALEEELGIEEGRAVFEDLVWVEDEEAEVTVPREEGVFPRTDADEAQREAAFQHMADLARDIPLELATGPGTGDAPEPSPGDGLGADGGTGDDNGSSAPDPLATAQAALEEWRSTLDGGSHTVAIGPERTADGSALLLSEPQLGYNPTLLVELEVQGGGYHARGVTVPGLPVVGIGYTDRVSWGVTTGNSKTIDSFIEETRRTDDGVLQHRHGGDWHDAECRPSSTPRSRCAARCTARSWPPPRTRRRHAPSSTTCGSGRPTRSRGCWAGTARGASTTSRRPCGRSPGTRTPPTPTPTATSPSGIPACTGPATPAPTCGCPPRAPASTTSATICPSRPCPTP
jgi:penicillin G amidase